MVISATSATLLGFAIGAGATVLGAVIGARGTTQAASKQKTREIQWQDAKRQQDGMEQLGQALIEFGQHHMDGAETLTLATIHSWQREGRALEARIHMLIEFYAPKLKQERVSLHGKDVQMRACLGVRAKEIREANRTRGSYGLNIPEEQQPLRSSRAFELAQDLRDECFAAVERLAELRAMRAR